MQEKVLGFIKKRPIELCVCLAIIIVMSLIFGEKDSFTLIKSEIVLEYGEKLPENLNCYIETDQKSDDIKIESDNIKDFHDLLNVGEYSIDFIKGSHVETLKVIVKDTTKPELSLKEDVNILENGQVDYLDFIDIYELSEYTTTIDDKDVVYDQIGDYKANVVVTDVYGNEADIVVPVHVDELTLELSKTRLDLYPDDTYHLQIDTNSQNEVSLTSDQSSVLTVDDFGNVKAMNPGTATICATVDGKIVECEVTVREKQTASSQNSSSKKSNSSNKSSAKKNTSNSSTNIGTTVYITNTGEKYHRSGCQYLRKSKIKISKSNAISRGFTPCSRCKP